MSPPRQWIGRVLLEVGLHQVAGPGDVILLPAAGRLHVCLSRRGLALMDLDVPLVDEVSLLSDSWRVVQRPPADDSDDLVDIVDAFLAELGVAWWAGSAAGSP